jgi:ubiquinone/menaquinone biosynthesis C-methylase UbiE
MENKIKYMKSFLKNNYRKVRNIFSFRYRKRELIQFKKEVWQSKEIAASFIKGSDGSSVIAAEMMDKEVNEFFLAECPAQAKVLDVGCGHGIVSIFLAKHGMRVTAMDISESLLAELNRRIAGLDLPIDVKRGDAYNLPFPEDHFDVIVARMFLPHFPDWPVVLKEMARVTKRGGKLLVHFSSKENTDLGKQIKQAECRFASSPDISNPWTFYAESDSSELKKVAKEIGLEITNRTPVSFFLHNRIIGFQLGTERYNEYMERVQDFMKEEKVKEFILWFDKDIISKCSPALSHFNIITFKKL